MTSLTARLWPRRTGTPPRPITGALIAPAACGGFLLLLLADGRRVMDSVCLGIRRDEYDHHPNPIEVLRADLALTERGLHRATTWTAKPCGCLSAPLTPMEGMPA